MIYDVAIVGGGASGYFAAIQLAELNPHFKIVILERGSDVLTKVRISGGGRCNVTHAEFDPGELVKSYPRGEKELLGPFHSFCSGDTIQFFEDRGIELKIEEDGRMFPVTDSSQTIIDCFVGECERLGVEVFKNHSLKSFESIEGYWELITSKTSFRAKNLVLATGSNPKVWDLLKEKGHHIIPPVPSLFTFNIRDQRIKGLPGLSTMAAVNIPGTGLSSEGPLLITHWGMSGPAILKLSAWGARKLQKLGYNFTVEINWLYQVSFSECLETLQEERKENPKKSPVNSRCFDLPKRLWISLVSSAGLDNIERWADLSNNQLKDLAGELTRGNFTVRGKSTFKEEFVTAGGVDLKEVNFKSFESKKLPGVYFTGEILNIDAITGGFNFQNAWTSAYMAARAITKKESR